MNEGKFQGVAFPTYVGMNRRSIGFEMNPECVPHIRGDEPLHGLRMLDPEIFTRLPLSSADSTNAAVNCGSLSRFGMYIPATSSQRAAVIADRIEQHNSAEVFVGYQTQDLFELSA